MPLYLFQNPKTLEVKEIIQRMSEPHVYRENGVEWSRVFIAPGTAKDTRINPFCAKQFSRKTQRGKFSIGDMWDYSKEMSDKRENKEGIDVLKQKYYDRYSKVRGGKRLHPNLRKEKIEKSKERLKKKGIIVER